MASARQFTLAKNSGAVIPAVVSTTVLAAFLPDGTVQNKFADILAQPGTLCTSGIALLIGITDADSSITSFEVYVEGYDVLGRFMTERYTSNTAGPGTYAMAKPFYSLTVISVIGVGFTVNDRIAVGHSGVLGLPELVTSSAQVQVARVTATPEAVPTINTTYNTWAPASAPDNARTYNLQILV